MDITEAKRFLSLLDPKARDFTFQTFTDLRSGLRSLSLSEASSLAPSERTDSNETKRVFPKTLSRSIQTAYSELVSANEDGAGIFVTINETDLRGRKTENITRVRAVWHEDDDGYSGEFPLEPSLVVQSSPGKFHRYWFLSDEMPFEAFHKVMGVMVDDYQSDPNARDLPRVMRLPGFFHRKGEPHKVKIIGGNEVRYTTKDLEDAFYSSSDSQPVALVTEGPTEQSSLEGYARKAGHEWDYRRVKDALSYLPPEERKDWFRYGAAIHDESGGSQRGFRIWDDWSKTTTVGNYDHATQIRYWNKEFGKAARPGNVTIATIYRDAKQYGFERTEGPWMASLVASPLLPEALPATPVGRSGLDNTKVDGDDFPKAVIHEVRGLFSDWGHSPSEDHWIGLSDIAKVYHRMATRCLAPQFYLSSLPCGMGKTTVATECTKALLGWSDYQNEGVIYFLSRLEEINSLVDAMGLAKGDFAVLVSDGRWADVSATAREKSNPEPGKARVLFTTQQQLEARLKGGGSFADVSAFHYRGRPRSVRIWDEAIIPSKVLTVERYGIDRLKANLKENGLGKLADVLDDWSYNLKQQMTGDIVTVPDVNSEIPDLESFRGMFSDTEDRDRAEALWYLSGRSVRVRRDNLSGTTTLDYEDNLPDDLAPMLVLDASGGLRKTYSFWQDHRKGLVRLHAPGKTYRGLTIHHWNKGAGKSANRDWRKAEEIADGVAKAVNSEIPLGEEILVIHHKRSSTRFPDIENMIRDKLNPRAKVHFCNWGKHTATNQYAHIRHVILAGILQYNEAQYEAVGRASKKAKTEDVFGEDEFQRTRFGEIAHNIFQAACRGSVRKTIDGDCPEGCNLYVIFSTDRKRGFSREGLSLIFPEVRMTDWQPVEKELSGKAKEVIDFVTSVLSTYPDMKLTSSEVMDNTGIPGKGNFTNIVNRDDFKAALSKAGIGLIKARGRGAQSHFARRGKTDNSPWSVPTKNAGLETSLPF